ncbi:MAG: hypothetical protein PHH01_05100 [Patescibacteria group bacterium]|nr:hypothetical protein [Patescibacteria group bacterium]
MKLQDRIVKKLARQKKGNNGVNEVAQWILKSQQVLRVVLELLQDRREIIRQRAIYAIATAAKLNPRLLYGFSRRLALKLFDYVFTSYRQTRKFLGSVFPGINEAEKHETIEQLTELLTSQSPVVREAAITGISNLGQSDASFRDLSFHAITIGLRDREPTVRCRAIKIMGDFCKVNPDFRDKAKPLLHDSLKDPARTVYGEARKQLKT